MYRILTNAFDIFFQELTIHNKISQSKVHSLVKYVDHTSLYSFISSTNLSATSPCTRLNISNYINANFVMSKTCIHISDVDNYTKLG